MRRMEPCSTPLAAESTGAERGRAACEAVARSDCAGAATITPSAAAGAASTGSASTAAGRTHCGSEATPRAWSTSAASAAVRVIRETRAPLAASREASVTPHEVAPTTQKEGIAQPVAGRSPPRPRRGSAPAMRRRMLGTCVYPMSATTPIVSQA